MKKTILTTVIVLTLGVAAPGAYAAIPTLTINDLEQVDANIANLTLTDANNTLLATGTMRTDANNVAYESLISFFGSASYTCGGAGLPVCGIYQWDLTEPGTGTNPGVWSDTLQLTYSNTKVNGQSIIGVNFFSDGPSGIKPIMQTADVFKGTFEENQTFPMLVDAQGNTLQSIAVISAVPEPESYGMMLGGLGLLGFMVRRKNSLS